MRVLGRQWVHVVDETFGESEILLHGDHSYGNHYLADVIDIIQHANTQQYIDTCFAERERSGYRYYQQPWHS